jgi:RNA polymerase sigma-70 factor (ECF subfamily)
MIAGLGGDSGAHKTLLQKLSGHLRAFFAGRLARICRGAAEAEDLVQEAMIAIHTRRNTYDPSQPLTPWVYAIARYKFLDHLRRTKGSVKEVPMEEAEEIVAQSEHADIESSYDLESLLAGISAKARQVIELVKLEGLSVSEAAARCGMSESAVKVAVHRGIKAMALGLKGKEGSS